MQFQVLTLQLRRIHSGNHLRVHVHSTPHDKTSAGLTGALDLERFVFLGGPDGCRKGQLKADMKHVRGGWAEPLGVLGFCCHGSIWDEDYCANGYSQIQGRIILRTGKDGAPEVSPEGSSRKVPIMVMGLRGESRSRSLSEPTTASPYGTLGVVPYA